MPVVRFDNYIKIRSELGADQREDLPGLPGRRADVISLVGVVETPGRVVAFISARDDKGLVSVGKNKMNYGNTPARASLKARNINSEFYQWAWSHVSRYQKDQAFVK
jgi:hypothetical protein